MKKILFAKPLALALSMVIFLMAMVVSANFVPNLDAEAAAHKAGIEAKYEYTDETVIFEGIDINPVAENFDVIVDELNDNEESHTKLIIQLSNEFDDGLTRPDNDNISDEEVTNILRQQRANVKEYYTRTNNEILPTLGLDELDVNYKADVYAPFIIAEFNNDVTAEDIVKIYQLAENDNIVTIFVKEDEKPEPELATAIAGIDGTTIVSDSSTNGSGVVIGILDGGIVNENNSSFENVTLTVRNEWWFNETVSDHAPQVAIVALGAAPGASLLSVEVYGEPSGEIGWMLDRDVNIINMSFGYTASSGFGNYTSESAYCDHIARNNWVTFVGSAGNRGNDDGYVTPPNGYNTVTVGACNDSGTLQSFSSYEENFNINFPNIMAPGASFSIPTYSGTHSGTSYSSPITAGTAAVLMQKYSAIKVYPEHVLSILMASARSISAYATTSGFHEKAGTGMLNMNNALNAAAATNRRAFTISSDAVGTNVNTRQVYLTSGQRLRVAFVSLVNNEKATSTNKVTDYDLKLVNSAGSQVASNVGTHNNEFIDYTVTSSGYYTIQIYQYSAKKTTLTDYCSYTYYIV